MVFSSSTDEHAVKRHHALTELIQQEADRRGHLSFARFMELALYAPRLGYYEQAGKSIGRKGDFFTSVSVGPLFGKLLACQFADWLHELPTDQPVIVEAGAHDGQLAEDILANLADEHPSLVERLEYVIIEPGATRRHEQQRRVAACGQRVRWFESWTELSSFYAKAGQGLTGIIFANELFDAMPAHRLRWSRLHRAWRELCVTRGHEGLAWIEREPEEGLRAFGDAIRGLLGGREDCPLWPCLPGPLLEVLPEGFTTEVCPTALHWWQEAARTLDRGRVMTLDYGFSATEFFQPGRENGTLRGYRSHRLTENLLELPGQQDITAHINFTLLQLAGESAGLSTDWLGPQSTFLTSILRAATESGTWNWSTEDTRQFQTLTHPDHLGRAFRVIVQSRGKLSS